MEEAGLRGIVGCLLPEDAAEEGLAHDNHGCAPIIEGLIIERRNDRKIH